MKKFFEVLREHAMKIINYEKKQNYIINKGTAGITRKDKDLLHLQKKV